MNNSTTLKSVTLILFIALITGFVSYKAGAFDSFVQEEKFEIPPYPTDTSILNKTASNPIAAEIYEPLPPAPPPTNETPKKSKTLSETEEFQIMMSSKSVSIMNLKEPEFLKFNLELPPFNIPTLKDSAK